MVSQLKYVESIQLWFFMLSPTHVYTHMHSYTVKHTSTSPTIYLVVYATWMCMDFSFLFTKAAAVNLYPALLKISISFSGWLCNLLKGSPAL